jgi:hypothetical protein
MASVGSTPMRDAYKMAAYELAAYEMAYVRGMPMRCTPMRWPMKDARLWETLSHRYAALIGIQLS